MTGLLADTHAVLWHLFNPQRLSAAADQAIQAAQARGEILYISTLTIIEVCYLVEKGRVPAQMLTDLLDVLKDPSKPIKELPVDLEVAEACRQIPRSVVPDPPDRVIAATSLAKGLPLVTCDPKIQAAPITTIW